MTFSVITNIKLATLVGKIKTRQSVQQNANCRYAERRLVECRGAVKS
jgi:hypothetical protein